MTQKVLIIGASGQVGKALMKALFKDFDAVGTYYSNKEKGLLHLNINNRDEVEAIFNKIKPDVAILTSALTNVDYCEEHKNTAEEINILGTKNVVEECKKMNAKLVFLSTEYVFDGKNGPYSENDKENPINVYGKTKLMGENMVKKLKNYAIVRTVTVYNLGYDKKNFLSQLLLKLKANKEAKVPSDQISTPTNADNLAEAIKLLVIKDKKGIYNAAGSERISRYEFAVKAARVFNLNADLIKPIKTSFLNQRAKRPLNAGLKIDKLNKEIGISMYDAEKGLKYFKDKIGSKVKAYSGDI